MLYKNICIIGAGYVGLAVSAHISSFARVRLVEIDKIKLNNLVSPEPNLETDIKKAFKSNLKNISFSDTYLDKVFDIFILCLPTNLNSNNQLDTSIIEKSIADIRAFSKSPIIIKSTVPIGFTQSMNNKFNDAKIFFVPEFLREGKGLADCLSPSRIIIGSDTFETNEIESLFKSNTLNNPNLIQMSTKEAEAAKLFSNLYLGMRVSFFNELDSFAFSWKLDSQKIIEGVSTDPRIGNFYNNPSFGFGGYCLPKDISELSRTATDTFQILPSAVMESNYLRINFMASEILKMGKKNIGIYKPTMKKDSDNHRNSSVIEVATILKNNHLNILIFDQRKSGSRISEFQNTANFKEFIKNTDLILANRLDPLLEPYSKKVFTRDIFKEN